LAALFVILSCMLCAFMSPHPNLSTDPEARRARGAVLDPRRLRDCGWGILVELFDRRG
jgi:hypothetical protein